MHVSRGLQEKFKEKKAQVVKEAQNTLQIMYTAGCLDMVEIQAGGFPSFHLLCSGRDWKALTSLVCHKDSSTLHKGRLLKRIYMIAALPDNFRFQ